MNNSNDITGEVELLIEEALRASIFEPADKVTLANIRSFISHGMSDLKDGGSISGYRINVEIADENKIVGDVTFTPVQSVDNINIIFNVDDEALSPQDKFDRAMKGI